MNRFIRTGKIKLIISTIFLIFSTNVFSNTINWTHQTINDLSVIRRTLIENTMQYEDQFQPFMNWLNKGFNQAVILAKRSNTKAGYYYALSYYTYGFHNGHIAVTNLNRVNELPFYYAGMFLKYNQGQYIVDYRDEHFGNLPPLHAKLISCDGQTAQYIVQHDIIPYRFIPKLESSYNRASSYMFFDANPFRQYAKQCLFSVNGEKIKYKIHWKTLSPEEAVKVGKDIYPSYSFRMQLFGNTGLWISIPTLFPEGVQRKFLELIIRESPSLRFYDPIVVDVRGDSGGSSLWALHFLYGLYGEPFVDEAIEKNDHGYEVYRVSKLNIDRMFFIGKQYPSVLSLGKELSYAYEHKIKSLKVPQEASFDDISKSNDKHRGSLSLFNHHIYFLTDSICFSSCLDFADYIHWLPHATHIGLPTNADSPYNEDNDFLLPGGAHFMYTMKVWRNRPRGDNQPYIPKYQYHGDITNTSQLMLWVLKLYQNKKF